MPAEAHDLYIGRFDLRASKTFQWGTYVAKWHQAGHTGQPPMTGWIERGAINVYYPAARLPRPDAPPPPGDPFQTRAQLPRTWLEQYTSAPSVLGMHGSPGTAVPPDIADYARRFAHEDALIQPPVAHVSAAEYEQDYRDTLKLARLDFAQMGPPPPEGFFARDGIHLAPMGDLGPAALNAAGPPPPPGAPSPDLPFAAAPTPPSNGAASTGAAPSDLGGGTIPDLQYTTTLLAHEQPVGEAPPPHPGVASPPPPPPVERQTGDTLPGIGVGGSAGWSDVSVRQAELFRGYADFFQPTEHPTADAYHEAFARATGSLGAPPAHGFADADGNVHLAPPVTIPEPPPPPVDRGESSAPSGAPLNADPHIGGASDTASTAATGEGHGRTTVRGNGGLVAQLGTGLAITLAAHAAADEYRSERQNGTGSGAAAVDAAITAATFALPVSRAELALNLTALGAHGLAPGSALERLAGSLAEAMPSQLPRGVLTSFVNLVDADVRGDRAQLTRVCHDILSERYGTAMKGFGLIGAALAMGDRIPTPYLSIHFLDAVQSIINRENAQQGAANDATAPQPTGHELPPPPPTGDADGGVAGTGSRPAGDSGSVPPARGPVAEQAQSAVVAQPIALGAPSDDLAHARDEQDDITTPAQVGPVASGAPAWPSANDVNLPPQDAPAPPCVDPGLDLVPVPAGPTTPQVVATTQADVAPVASDPGQHTEPVAPYVEFGPPDEAHAKQPALAEKLVVPDDPAVTVDGAVAAAPAFGISDDGVSGQAASGARVFGGEHLSLGPWAGVVLGTWSLDHPQEPEYAPGASDPDLSAGGGGGAPHSWLTHFGPIRTPAQSSIAGAHHGPAAAAPDHVVVGGLAPHEPIAPQASATAGHPPVLDLVLAAQATYQPAAPDPAQAVAAQTAHSAAADPGAHAAQPIDGAAHQQAVAVHQEAVPQNQEYDQQQAQQQHQAQQPQAQAQLQAPQQQQQEHSSQHSQQLLQAAHHLK